MSNNKISQLDLNDMNRILRLEEISLSANPKKQKTKLENLSIVSQEQIDDYKESLNIPILIDGIKYKYSQAGEIPQMLDYTPIVDVLDEKDINELRTIIKSKSEDIQRLNKINEKLRKNEIESILKIENSELSNRIKQVKINAIREKYQSDLDNYKNNIKDLEYDITYMQRLINENEKNISENQAEEQRIKKENQENIKTYKERLNELNRGSFNIEQFTNETEEDYLNRLEEIAKSPYDESRLKFESEMKNLKLIKKNLREIVKKDYDIENIIKSMSNNEIFEFNKYFGIIKQLIIKIYGVQNENVKANEYITLIGDILFYGKYGKEYENGIDDLSYLDETKIKPNYLNNLLKNVGKIKEYEVIENNEQKIETIKKRLEETNIIMGVNENSNCVYFHISDSREMIYFKISDTNSIYFSFENEVNSYSKLLKSIVKDVFNRVGINFEDITYILNIKTMNDFYKTLNLFVTPEKSRKIRYVGSYDREKKYGKTLIGFGLKNKIEIPSGLLQFGKTKINLEKLYYNNILVIKSKQGNSVIGLKNTPVSDNFVNLIMKLMQNENVSNYDIKNLNNKEQNLYNEVLYISGIHKDTHNNTTELTIENLKKRLSLLEGEIEAGNNNQQNLKELYEILFKLSNLKVISNNQARKHYNDIKNQFFN